MATTTKKRIKLPERTATFVFEDGDYNGIEVKVRLSVPMGLYLDIQDMIVAEKPIESYKVFADAALVEWNLDDDQGEIPANGEGMMRIEPRLATEIITRWTEAAASAPGPLPEPSANGDTSAVP